MGQQQILLIILVTILIGIATVLAIDIVEATSQETSKAAIRQDILMVINDAQIYYEKPKALGGGGYKFDNISNSSIKSLDPSNENGTYELSGSGESITVKGTSNDSTIVLTATATMSTNGMDISWSE